MPLAGTTLTRAGGTSNTVETVDWAGISRITSGNTRQHIPIEIFRWAIERILDKGFVTRAEINEQYAGRASSGIVLILSQVPEFAVSGLKLTLRSQPGAHR